MWLRVFSDLNKAIDEVVEQAPAEIRSVVEALEALREVAQTTEPRWFRTLFTLGFRKPTATDGL